MITGVRAVNRYAIQHVIATTSVRSVIDYNMPWVLISIYSGGVCSPELLTENHIQKLNAAGMQDSLSLRFWDITETDYAAIIYQDKQKLEPVLFSQEQARQSIRFIDKTIDSDEEFFVLVHCDAGISRSGAFAEFIQSYAFLDYDIFKLHHRHIIPNIFVKNMLNEAAREKGRFWNSLSSESFESFENSESSEIYARCCSECFNEDFNND